MTKVCNECGYPLKGNETSCPECGCPISVENCDTVTPSISTVASTSYKKDLAQYFYECGVIGWNAFKKYFCFHGRASRREYWSFELIVFLSTMACISLFSKDSLLLLLLLLSLVFLIPNLAVGVRRMHDINRSGWWIICPIAGFFMLFKQSDNNTNLYGDPYPATNYLDN